MEDFQGEVLREGVLRELVEVLGDATASTLLQKFSDDLAGHLAGLRSQRDDVTAVAGISHKLIGMAGGLGMEQLASASIALNGLAKTGAPAISPKFWDAYDDISRKALVAFAMWRRDQHS